MGRGSGLSACDDLLRSSVKRQPVVIAVGVAELGCFAATVDDVARAVKVAGIRPLVQAVRFPEPCCRSGGMHRLLKQARVMQELQTKSLATGKMIVVASNLNQPVA